MKENCWEYLKCGREPGGINSQTLGVCPAATNKATNGIHGGKNGGRCCWAITGTLCCGQVQGTFAANGKCTKCAFYDLVKRQEGSTYMSVYDIYSVNQGKSKKSDKE